MQRGARSSELLLDMLTPISSPKVALAYDGPGGLEPLLLPASALAPAGPGDEPRSPPSSARSKRGMRPPALAIPSPPRLDARMQAAAAAAAGAAAPDSACSASSQLPAALPRKWVSPPACAGCGSARTSGVCAGCGGRFCPSCMPAAGLADGCDRCGGLCNGCKPVACAFCEARRGSAATASRLCEACAGACDACQRTACGACRAAFRACAACGYAACEDCRLARQLGCDGAAAAGCWCEPPARAASDVRALCSQRFQQLAAVHPSLLAASMEAAGLREADDEDCFEGAGCEEDEDSDADADMERAHHASWAAGGLGREALGAVLLDRIGSLSSYGGALSPRSSSLQSHSSSWLERAGLAGSLGSSWPERAAALAGRQARS